MTTPPRSPGRPAVPLQRIVETAVAIVDSDGAAALSMRTLAQRLGSGTATLYRHVSGRGELLAFVVDAVMGEARISAEQLHGLAWGEAMTLVARDMFDVLRSHPNVAPLLVAQTPTGPNAMALRERALAVLVDTGFTPQLAVRAWATTARYVLGFATQTHADDQVSSEAPRWPAFDADRYPVSMAVAAGGPVEVSLEDEFDFGLAMLVSGMEQQLSFTKGQAGGMNGSGTDLRG